MVRGCVVLGLDLDKLTTRKRVECVSLDLLSIHLGDTHCDTLPLAGIVLFPFGEDKKISLRS
jgi:hypothetical protein